MGRAIRLGPKMASFGLMSSASIEKLMGEAGTGGKMLRLTGRRLTFGFGGDKQESGPSKVAPTAVRGDEHVKLAFHILAVEGGRVDRYEGLRGVPLSSSSGEDEDESSSI